MFCLGALLAGVRPATRGGGTIAPDFGGGLGLGGVAFHLETPAAILVSGLMRELDGGGKPRRDAQGRPASGRRGAVASDAGCFEAELDQKAEVIDTLAEFLDVLRQPLAGGRLDHLWIYVDLPEREADGPH